MRVATPAVEPTFEFLMACAALTTAVLLVTVSACVGDFDAPFW